jgi:outer membrane protein assembly factor BamE (lipoprotein component of BamABCDE complex)
MKYRWYYIEVFRDAKERFEKQKTAGAEIPQQSLLEGAFEYLDQRHSLGEEEQYDQDQTWRHRMESGCGDSDLCTDLYWVLTFCSMMSDLGVYLDGMVQGNAEGFKRGLNKVMEPFDGRLSYGEQAAYRLDVICYVVMTMNDHMDRSEEACQRIADILGKLWIALDQQIEENGKIARISRYVENNQECLRDSTMLTERVLAQDNGPEEGEEPEMPVKAIDEPEADDPDEAEEDHDDEPDDQGSRRGNRAVMDTQSRGKSHGFGKKIAGIGIALVVIGLAAIGIKSIAGSLVAGIGGTSFELVSDETAALSGLEHLTGGTLSVSSQLTGKSGTVYGAAFLNDGDTSTPWEEGVEGDGIGEQITYEPESGTKLQVIRIYPGNGRSDKAFQENNRPKTITLEIDGKKQTLNFDDAGHFYTFSSKKPVTAKQVKLIIDSVYPGSKWQDTCISEVEFYGTR